MSRAKIYAAICLNSRTITSRITAPMKARMIAPSTPPQRQGDPEDGEQEARDQRAEDAHDDIADQAEARPLHEQAGEPTRDCADDTGDDDCCQHCFPQCFQASIGQTSMSWGSRALVDPALWRDLIRRISGAPVTTCPNCATDAADRCPAVLAL